ncbi:MAG: hypothetical protein KKD18_02520 [Nanoarchaeota archaeon]|nr:hypothetical protein [Nanoarchaeota archaeon]MBU0977265.1 hypothetical protein [Nanoarchaeota archaeon]
MRKIGSEKQIEQRRKRNTLILSVFMLFVLVGGTAGYAFITNQRTNDGPTNSENNEGSQLANLIGNRWVINVDGKDMSFTNPPEEVFDVPVTQTNTVLTYSGKPLYVVSTNNAVNAEVAAVLGNYASRVQRSCYGPCDDDLPEKDCSENLIIWRDAPENRVYQDENCIFIEGDLKAVDAFLYNLLGIKPQ